MWTALFSALAALPGIFGYIEKFAMWLSSQIDDAKKAQARKDMQDAVDKAKKQKDTSNMDHLFDPTKPGKKP